MDYTFESSRDKNTELEFFQINIFSKIWKFKKALDY